MSTEQSITDYDRPEITSADLAPAVPNSAGAARTGSTRKSRQRSIYLFPVYGFNTALDIARRVEESGGGMLTEETLAVNLGLSVKSSGFRLKSLAARQFQLISKQGETLTTTPTAKAIFKPTSNDDALRGYRQSFMAIPLFQAVADRYRGQRLPDSQTLRNVLEREFHVDHARVQQAERMLLDSARDTYLLKHQGDGTYLATSENTPWLHDEPGPPGEFGMGPVETSHPSAEGSFHPASPQHNAPVPANTIAFTLDEIGQLSAEDFETVWRAIGILVRSRSGLSKAAPDLDGDDWIES